MKQAISAIINLSDLVSVAQFTGDIKADLTRIVQAYQDSAVTHGGFITALFSEMSRHPELVDSIDEPLTIFMEMSKLIARYQVAGQLRKEHPLHLLAVLLGPVMYTTMLRKVMPNSPLPPLDLSNHVKCFLEGHSA